MRESVLSSETVAPCARATSKESTSSACAMPRLRWSRRTARRGMYAVGLSVEMKTSDTPTTAPAGSSATRKFHGSIARATARGGREVLVGLALPLGPLEEGVLEHVVRRLQVRLERLAHDVARGQVTRRDLRALRQLQDPARPADPVAERRQQPIPGRPLRHRHADDRGAARSPECPQPGRQPGADPAAAVGREHGRVAAVGAQQLGVRHQQVTVEHRDRGPRQVVARLRPVADEVGLLDVDRRPCPRVPGRRSGRRGCANRPS